MKKRGPGGILVAEGEAGIGGRVWVSSRLVLGGIMVEFRVSI